MRKVFLCLLACIAAFQLAADEHDVLRIRVLAPTKPGAVQVITENGRYAIVADGKRVLELDSADRFSVINNGSSATLKTPAKNYGGFSKIELQSLSGEGVFRIYVISPNKDERVYDDNLIFLPGSGSLQLINQVELEKYVAGVVEAETGKEKPLEFYKVQAIISRTYALNNKHRYRKMGFDLNDQVDCQVYHGKARWEDDILTAVEETRGKVLVDSEMRMITAAFHSNSGGETVSSDIVWSGALSYLSPRKDEFSLNGEHAEWEETIHRGAWLHYLRDKYNLNTDDKLLHTMAVNYEQNNRHIYFLDPIFNIPLKDIRKDWKLNSTYFSIAPLGRDSLHFTGRGFGHGTGLSQEGAMRMAELGFSYTDILHFYYNDVHVIDLKAINFFRAE
ncbi:MAG: SpoIID/LytB domain-containing protein [Flavobacteriales bacterium]|nr:SpoIID/LytB domain-containing protein [Flavobacteriales bacterium]